MGELELSGKRIGEIIGEEKNRGIIGEEKGSKN